MNYVKYIIINTFLILFLLILVTSYLVGAKPLIVLSNSMSPSINKGDLLIVLKNKHYKVNDVISFENKGNIVTHRVASKNNNDSKNNIWFETRGDANKLSDLEFISNKNVLGKVEIIIPFLGLLLLYLQSKYFIYLLLVLFIFAFIKRVQNVKN